MYAEITAIGLFRQDLIPDLEYPAETYEGTANGAVVIVDLFGIVEGSSASRQFANLLGISDPWDFNQHRIDPNAVDIDGLRAFVETLAGAAAYARDIERLERLRSAGFDFYFRPNG
jgi:hypothetical protein